MDEPDTPGHPEPRPHGRPGAGNATDRKVAIAWQAARAWARSGVMDLCGYPEGPPLLPPLGVPARLCALAAELEQASGALGQPVRISWEAALAGRAALLKLRRHGRISPNGTCRLLTTPAGEMALNLARPEDLDLLPALIAPFSRRCQGSAGWQQVEAAARLVPASKLVAQARLLGLPAAVVGERTHPGRPAGAFEAPFILHRRGIPRLAGRREPGALRVVDLSGLWAGPLAARILAEMGAEVLKVEDPARPDGARSRPEFYRWVHHPEEQTVALSFATHEGRARLRALVASADVVIEGSRARALEQIGLSPERHPGPPGQVWLSITGHGRHGEAAGWVGLGDDAAAAGGLVARDAAGRAVFAGDALADPIAGLVGALAVLRALHQGGGQLAEVSLSGTAAWAAGEPATSGTAIDGPEVIRQQGTWILRWGDQEEPVAAPSWPARLFE